MVNGSFGRSQLGYLPGEIPNIANGVQASPDASVLYAYPTGFHMAQTVDMANAAATLTTKQLLSGLLLVDPNGGAQTLTLPDAGDICDAFPSVNVNNTLRVIIRNTADAAETITIAMGNNITSLAGNTLTVAQNNTAEYVLLFTNVTPPDDDEVSPTDNRAATWITVSSANVH